METISSLKHRWHCKSLCQNFFVKIKGVGTESIWHREDHFGKKWTNRPLSDFISPPDLIRWIDRNPSEKIALTAGARKRKRDQLLDWLIREGSEKGKWRSHHGIMELVDPETLYEAYQLRVETMHEMLSGELQHQKVDMGKESFLDLACSEGYTANFLYEMGAGDIDVCELSDINIERLWKIRAYLNYSYGRVGKVDLDNTAWSRSFQQKYDVVLALGIIYHLENPLLFCRNLFEVTKKIAFVESDTPNFPSNERFRGYGTMYLHRDQVTLHRGNIRYIQEFRPDRLALVEMLLQSGFSSVKIIHAPEKARSHYFESENKSLVVAVV